jgi:diguanylate cyclase (GGDEF)-like protein
MGTSESVTSRHEASRGSRLRAVLSLGYEGADAGNAARLTGAICSLSALLALAFLPLDAPNEPIGSAGWAVAGGLIVTGFVAGRRLRGQDPPPSFATLLAIGYLGLAATAVLQWLGGGIDAPYRDLTLLWLSVVMGTHPPRQALPFLLVATLATAAPLVYENPTGSEIDALVADYLIWLAFSVVILVLMTYVRAQRVRLREQEREAQELARADQLCGLGNRRAFDEALEVELARSGRAGSTTTVALLDLDRFKEINDRFGHLDGDRCLREAATAIGRALRAGDRAFRWGGDEFAIVLPDTALDGARAAVERIADEVASTCAAANGAALSVSWGVAEAEAGMDARELLDRADLAMMTLKRERLET